MVFRFRIWMPLIAVLIVLLSIVVMLIYALPASRARLGDYAEREVLSQAVSVANQVAGERGRELRRSVESAADRTGGEVLVVDRSGGIRARAGPRLLPNAATVLRRTAERERMVEQMNGLHLAKVPVFFRGNVTGAAVVVYGNSQTSIYRIFLRSGLEAAAVASLLGGGLMLFLATLLSRRVERLSSGARVMAQGDLSHRLEEPGLEDELGELARTLNSMAASLEDSFRRLEENDITLHAILDNLNEGVVATDLKGNVVFANAAAREMLGMKAGDAQKQLPNPFRDFDLPEAVSRCARGRGCAEARVERDGSFLNVNLEHMPAFDEHRGGVLIVLRDLSEGRRLEAAQQRFLADAAHELRTPITAILGSAELLATGEDDPEARRRFINHILSEARRMQRLSDTLLRLARAGWDMREPDLGTVDLEATVRSAIERAEPLAESSQVGIGVEGRGDGVRADAGWLEQALLILLGNAVKHSQRGGSVTVRLSGTSVTVEDEGEGIAEEDLPHVFERFYRGKSGSGGFGLGLHICRELVEKMGGRISIRSKKGVGTSVRIDLPEAHAEDTAGRG